ncbi:MAG: ATPase, T2SS/T4P/T4SS family, partial [Eubacteriales bacterium]
PPVVDAPAISIRKHGMLDVSLDELEEGGVVDNKQHLLLSALVKGKKNIIISGGMGSGKTTLAQILSDKYGAGVINMDDFFLPHERKTTSRLSEADGNIDRERFLSEAIPHLKDTAGFSYRRYDCHKGSLAETIYVPYSKLLVIEGVYSLSECFIQNYNIKIMLTVSEEEQHRRLYNRCGREVFEKFLSTWLPLEKRYFESCGIEEKCDLVI